VIDKRNFYGNVVAMTTQITVEENIWGGQNNLLTYVCLFE